MTNFYTYRFSEDVQRGRYSNEPGSRYGDRRRRGGRGRHAEPGAPWYGTPYHPDYQFEEDRNIYFRNENSYGDENAWERQQRWVGEQEGQHQPRYHSSHPDVSGPYYGVGPRNYRRSDIDIQDDVCELLTQHGKIDAREIEVNVDGGEVTLLGKVSDRFTKRLAEDVALSVQGVWDVHNRLQLARK
jgi:hypothetical protein